MKDLFRKDPLGEFLNAARSDRPLDDHLSRAAAAAPLLVVIDGGAKAATASQAGGSIAGTSPLGTAAAGTQMGTTAAEMGSAAVGTGAMGVATAGTSTAVTSAITAGATKVMGALLFTGAVVGGGVALQQSQRETAPKIAQTAVPHQTASAPTAAVPHQIASAPTAAVPHQTASAPTAAVPHQTASAPTAAVPNQTSSGSDRGSQALTLADLESAHDDPATRAAPDSADLSGSAQANVRAEARLIQDAWKALGSTPSAAFQLAQRHSREFREGRLAEEAQAIQIQALHAMGRTSEARQLLRTLQSRLPNSVHVAYLRKLVTAEAP